MPDNRTNRRKGVRFNGEVSIGHVLIALASVVSIIGSWYVLPYRIDTVVGELRSNTVAIASIQLQLKDHLQWELDQAMRGNK